jgi:hypothetical protein
MTDEKLPMIYVAIYEVLKLAALKISVFDATLADQINNSFNMLKGIRLPEPSKELTTAAHKKVIKILTLSSLSIYALCGFDLLNGTHAMKGLAKQVWNGLLHEKSRMDYGMELLGAHDILLAVNSKILKSDWQATRAQARKNIVADDEDNGEVYDDEEERIAASAHLGSGHMTRTAGGRTIFRRSASNKSLQEQIAEMDPNLTGVARADELKRLERNVKSRIWHAERKARWQAEAASGSDATSS